MACGAAWQRCWLCDTSSRSVVNWSADARRAVAAGRRVPRVAPGPSPCPLLLPLLQVGAALGDLPRHTKRRRPGTGMCPPQTLPLPAASPHRTRPLRPPPRGLLVLTPSRRGRRTLRSELLAPSTTRGPPRSRPSPPLPLSAPRPAPHPRAVAASGTSGRPRATCVERPRLCPQFVTRTRTHRAVKRTGHPPTTAAKECH